MREDLFAYRSTFVPHPTRKDYHFLRYAIDSETDFLADLSETTTLPSKTLSRKLVGASLLLAGVCAAFYLSPVQKVYSATESLLTEAQTAVREDGSSLGYSFMRPR